MQDRNVCIYYDHKGADCKKGFKAVAMKKCKNCKKHQGRKGVKTEDIKSKRQKDKDKHDCREI